MDNHNIAEPMSESVEMYLLRIALLQDEDRPVPMSALAEGLSVSSVSANQMCRRLEERGMVHYEPYRGVTLTLQGEAAAMRVLRKRRLWEVFLSENLGMEPQQAEEIACRLEHATPDGLAERLAGFLGNPTMSPQQQPIPPSIGAAVRRPSFPLARLGVGLKGHVVTIEGNAAATVFARDQGLVPGASVKVLAVAANDSMLVEVAHCQLSLSPELTHQITVAPQRSVGASAIPDDVDTME